MSSVTINGTTYSAQYRKCGSPTCHCAQPGDKGHGPYYYARDLATGRRRYIGRQLPDNIFRALLALDRRDQEIRDTRAQMYWCWQTLNKLLNRQEYLTVKEAQFIASLGWTDCLVHTEGLATTQESETE